MRTPTGNAPVVLSFEIAAGVTGLLEQAFKPSAGRVLVDGVIDEAANTIVNRHNIPLSLVFEVVEREIKPRLQPVRNFFDAQESAKK